MNTTKQLLTEIIRHKIEIDVSDTDRINHAMRIIRNYSQYKRVETPRLRRAVAVIADYLALLFPAGSPLPLRLGYWVLPRPDGRGRRLVWDDGQEGFPPVSLSDDAIPGDPLPRPTRDMLRQFVDDLPFLIEAIAKKEEVVA